MSKYIGFQKINIKGKLLFALTPYISPTFKNYYGRIEIDNLQDEKGKKQFRELLSSPNFIGFYQVNAPPILIWSKCNYLNCAIHSSESTESGYCRLHKEYRND